MQRVANLRSSLGTVWQDRPAARPQPLASALFDRLALALAVRALGRPALRLRLWDGWAVGSKLREVATVRIRDRATLLRVAASPSRALASAYERGAIAIDGSLTDALTALLEVDVERAFARSDDETVVDPGTEFYRTWLDDRLVHASGWFEGSTRTLEQAQSVRLDRICDALALRPGDRLVELACGRGALAIHAACRHGVLVRAYDPSAARIDWARRRARALGVADRVQFVTADPSRVEGTYDACVSLAALERSEDERHALARIAARCLSARGRGLLEVPSLPRTLQTLAKSGAIATDIDAIGPHCARTLEHWLERFEAATRIVAGFFGDAFVRRYRFHLARSLAAFRVGARQTYEVRFARRL